MQVLLYTIVWVDKHLATSLKLARTANRIQDYCCIRKLWAAFTNPKPVNVQRLEGTAHLNPSDQPVPTLCLPAAVHLPMSFHMAALIPAITSAILSARLKTDCSRLDEIWLSARHLSICYQTRVNEAIASMKQDVVWKLFYSNLHLQTKHMTQFPEVTRKQEKK